MSILLPAPPAQRIARAGLGLQGELATQLLEAVWGQYQPNRSFTSKGNQFWLHPKGYIQSVQTLVAQGVDVDADLNGHGATALHKAAEESDLELVSVLVSAGANLNRQADLGLGCRWTALHFVVQKRTLPAIEVLLNAGARFALEGVVGDASTTAYAIAMQLRGKNNKKVKDIFYRLRRHAQRLQTLCIASVMHPRLGFDSPARWLPPDLIEMILILLPVANLSVAEAALQDLHHQ